MRRRQSEITDPQEISRILSAATIGRLATLGADGYPYITPVNYVYTNSCIYFHCALRGEKLDNIARDDRVCFEVDIPLAYLDLGFNPDGGACSLHQFYHCVIIRGRARVVPDGDLKPTALNALVAAETMVGQDDHKVIAIPHDRLREVMKKYGRLMNDE